MFQTKNRNGNTYCQICTQIWRVSNLSATISLNHKDISSKDTFYTPHWPAVHCYITQQGGCDGVVDWNQNHIDGKSAPWKWVFTETDVWSQVSSISYSCRSLSSFHISCVTSDRLCVSNRENNLIWTNTTGVTLHCVKVLCKYDTDILTGNGLHTMNSKCELIYIESKFNIKKRLKIMKNNFYLSKEKNLYMKTAVCLLVPIQWGFTGRDI